MTKEKEKKVRLVSQNCDRGTAMITIVGKDADGVTRSETRHLRFDAQAGGYKAADGTIYTLVVTR